MVVQINSKPPPLVNKLMSSFTQSASTTLIPSKNSSNPDSKRFTKQLPIQKLKALVTFIAIIMM